MCFHFIVAIKVYVGSEADNVKDNGASVTAISK